MATGAFLGIDDFQMHAHAARHGRKVVVALHLLFGAGQPDASVRVVVIDRVLRVFRQFLVEIDRVGLESDHRLIGAKIGHLCRRMPSGSTGQFVAFDQHHVTPAFLGQVVQR